MEPKRRETETTYWHPAFYADIQIELKDDADNLVFENEHQLSKKPMEIDVLIIKKDKNRPVKKNIGKIFRKHNILEYKGPGDSLSVDDFYKVYGYTCFYKADVPYVDSIPASELTITFVSESYPREFIKYLREEKKYKVGLEEPGIYSVNGDSIPIQIIVTRQLSEKENLWLKSLTNNLNETKSAERLVEDYLENKENSLYHSVIEIIAHANQKIFEEVNGMSDIFMEIVKEKFDRKLKEELDRATEEMAQQMKQQMKQQVMQEVTEQVTQQVTQEVTEQVTQEVTEQVTQEVTEQVTQEVTEQVTQEVTKQVTQEVTEQVTQEVTQQVTHRTRLLDCIALVKKKCAKNKTLSIIADELESEPDEISRVYDTIISNPEKTVEEIYELIAE